MHFSLTMLTYGSTMIALRFLVKSDRSIRISATIVLPPLVGAV